MKSKKIVILGASLFAEIAHEYFEFDSEFKVDAFSVEREYREKSKFLDKPIVDFEEIESRYAPSSHGFYAAFVYTFQNRLRERFYLEAKEKGYSPASYISSRAFVWRNCEIDEHCFIFENNVVQPFVKIGKNVVLWSGNHIGHHGVIHDHVFISSHVVVSGNCDIGSYTFIGVNTTIADGIRIGANCLIGAGALILADVPDNTKVVGKWTKKSVGKKLEL
jgi:sugar O-acyltransferase (sialic acid O-acetyltransferase NeuD family)